MGSGSLFPTTHSPLRNVFMIIVMEENATEEQIVQVVDRLVNLGFDIHRSTGARYTLLGAVGSRITDTRELELLEGVNKVVRVSSPYKLAARAFKPKILDPYRFGETHPARLEGLLKGVPGIEVRVRKMP
mgnify:CR=1 FL=1